MRAPLISGEREQTAISLLHLIPFYLPIVATASLERADAGSRSSIARARRAPRSTPRSRSSDISIPAREIRYLYLRININKRPARAVLTLVHTARSRALSDSFATKDRPLWNTASIRHYETTRRMFFFIVFPAMTHLARGGKFF